MPTYIYKRQDGSTFEITQRITEAPLAVCPTTGQRVTRVIGGGGGLIFKGDGFYQTDYARKDSRTASASSENSSRDGKADASDAKTESSAETAPKSDAPSS